MWFELACRRDYILLSTYESSLISDVYAYNPDKDKVNYVLWITGT